MNKTTQSPSEILLEIHRLHRDGKFIKAADSLLDFFVLLLEEDRMSDIDELLSLLKTSLIKSEDRDLYDNNGLARIHTMLALSLRTSQSLPSRKSLRSAYKDMVQEREGREVAQNAVRHL